MEISQLKYFRAVVEYGTFSDAAAHLYITQPALSKSIKKLEGELGTALFDRRGAHLTLTAAGRVFLPYAGTVLNTVESAGNAVRERIGLKQGQVSIAISTEVFIKHLIFRFLSENPGVSFTCHLMDREEMISALQDGSVDFVLSDQPIVGDDLDWHVLCRSGLNAVLSGDDPLLSRPSIRMEDLRDHYFCIGHVRSSLNSAIYQLCGEAGFQPKIRYLGYDPDMAGMLMELPGSVLISSDSIELGVREANISPQHSHSVPIEGTYGRAVVGFSARVGHYQSEAALAFYDLVVSHYRELDRSDDSGR